MSWKSVWERKGSAAADETDLRQLIALDGFDVGAGEFPVEGWLSYVNDTKTRLGLREGLNVLEVGCGAGAMLAPLYDSGVTVYGIDYSEPHIRRCSRSMPSGTFRVSEADTIPFGDEYFDAVISHSVFQYFEDLAYAARVLSEITRVLKKKGRAAVLDINDAAKKDACESAKMERVGDDAYRELYGSLRHQFYSKAWFHDRAADLGWSCEIHDQTVEAYANAAFRFNVLLEKA